MSTLNKPANWSSTALLAVVLTASIQLLRVFFPSVGWYLKDTVGVSSVTLMVVVLGMVCVGFLAGLLWKIAGPRYSLWLTAGGVALMRIVEQIIHSPQVDVWLSLAGSIMFVLFLPVFVGYSRIKDGERFAFTWVLGIIFGLALDSLIRGFSSTLDLSWIEGMIPVIVILLLTGSILVLLLTEKLNGELASTDTRWRNTLPLLAFGPFLMLQLTIFQNQGWISEISGLDSNWAFVTLMAGNLTFVLGAFMGFTQQQSFRTVLAVLASILILIVVAIADQPRESFILALLLVQFLFGWSWSYMSTYLIQTDRSGIGRTTIMSTLGLLFFILLVFFFYASLVIALPIPREIVPPIAAIIFGVAFLGVASLQPRPIPVEGESRAPALIAWALVILSLIWLPFQTPPPSPIDPDSGPITVMTYNIHSAYSIEGRQDPEAIALVIEENGANIVAIQEISRGWLINGSTDLTSWLSNRLGMQVLYKGTTGPMWGIAILTKYPILEHGYGDLPSLYTLIDRSYQWAQLDVGSESPVNVIGTHLHHVGNEGEIRLAQVEVLLAAWDDQPHTLLLGDLNARPWDPELKPLFDAGFIDSWAEAGVGDGLTFISNDPFQRIDWIWHTQDLATEEVEVIETTASDHFPLAATIVSAP